MSVLAILADLVVLVASESGIRNVL